jgi:phage-related protein
MKQTQKTPQKEINQAKRNLADLKERTKSDEQK